MRVQFPARLDMMIARAVIDWCQWHGELLEASKTSTRVNTIAAAVHTTQRSSPSRTITFAHVTAAVPGILPIRMITGNSGHHQHHRVTAASAWPHATCSKQGACTKPLHRAHGKQGRCYACLERE